MLNFTFYNPARIIFGDDTELKTGEWTQKYGAKKVLLHYGQSSIKKNGLFDKVVQSLNEKGIAYVELGGVVPNPRWSLVKEGIELVKKEGIDFILAVGGGSVIDSAKAIAAGARYQGDLWDVFMNGGAIVDALPMGVVLTIPAAGSESSSGSVITNEEGWFKRSIGGEVLIPKFAIINPKYHLTLPAYQTACGIADMFAHLLERYFTQVDNVDYTDRLIEASMKSLIHMAPLVVENPDDLNVRKEIAWIGTMAHNGTMSTGRLGDWASHNIEHELSGIYDIAHGAGLTIIFPAWMKYVYKYNPARFEQFARRVFDVDYAYDQQEKTILEGIKRYERFAQSIGLPVRLSDVQIGDDRLKEMAEKCMVGRSSTGQFVKLKEEDVYQIYLLAK